MPAFIQDFIKKCDTCQRIKADRHKQKGLLMPLYLPELPWSSISVDWMRGLPPHRVGTTTYESILIVIDRCTKMVHLIPTNESETSEQTARLLLRHVFKYHGFPRAIHSDRDSRLTSAYFREMCRLLHVSITQPLPTTHSRMAKLNKPFRLFVKPYASYTVLSN